MTVAEPWEESEIWQEPRPAIWVDGATACITDPAAKKLQVVSLKNIAEGRADIFSSVDLPETPNGVAGVTGKSSEH